MEHITIIDNIRNIEILFDILNKHFFNDCLERPILTLNPGSTRRNKGKTVTLGWCTTKKIWINKENNESYYEITICPEFIDRSLEEICATLLHEMTHLLNLKNNIQDVSRNGYFHNRKFKYEAEKHGLVITKVDGIGWSKTQLSNEAKVFISGIDIKMRKITRQPIDSIGSSGDDENEEVEKKKKSIKYVCPECKISVRATKVVNIRCDDCNCLMVDQDDLIEKEE